MSIPPLRISLLCFFILLAHFASAQSARDVEDPRLLLPVRVGQKWGFADTAKNMVITPEYDAANNFSDGLAIVEKNKKAFAIDQTGRVLTPGFDNMLVLEDTILAIYLNEVSDSLGGWGICTRSGFVILPPAYDEIVTLTADLFSFRKDSLWGFVARNGTIIKPPTYISIAPASRNFLRVTKNNKAGLIGFDGTSYLDIIYSRIYVPNKWIVAGYLDKNKDRLPKGWVAYDLASNLFIPHGADSIFRVGEYFVGSIEHDSIACYFSRFPGRQTQHRYKKLDRMDEYWVLLNDFSGQFGLVDTTGKVIVPVGYTNIAIGGMGNWFVSDKNKKWGFYNSNGEMMLAPTYTAILPFRANVTTVFEGSMQGLINFRGELLVAPDDQRIIIRGNTVKIIRRDNTASFLRIDESGRVADKSDYDEFRVIKVVGVEASVNVGPDNVITPTRGRGGFTLTVDSLNWFMNPRTTLWGLRNTFTNDTVIPAQFSFIEATRDGYTIVGIHELSTGIIIDGKASVTSDRYGLVENSTGKIILKPNYATIHKEDLNENGFRGFVRVTLSSGSMALVTTDGNERTMSFTYIDAIHDGYARFCIGGKYSIENPGERIADVMHFSTLESINIGKTFGSASESKNFMDKIVSITGGQWGYLDTAGRTIIQPVYDAAKQVTKETGIVKKDKKWGMIDMKGATRIPIAYDALYYMAADTGTFVIAQMNGIRYGYIDRNGNIKIPADLKQSKVLGKGFIAFTKTGRWGVMNSQGVVVCNEAYHEIYPFSEGIAAVRLGNKWGYIDTSGTEIIAPMFEKAGEFKSGTARVVKNQRWGYIDLTGTFFIEPKFLFAGNFSGSAAPLRTRDGFGLMGLDGKWILKPVHQKVIQLDTFLTGFFVLRNDNSASVCRRDGKIIIPAKYESYKYLGEGIIGCRNGKDWIIADTSGKILSSAIFEQVKPFSEHRAGAAQNGKWGFINRSGKFIVPPKYAVVGNYVDHMAYAFISPNSYILDTLGNIKVHFEKGLVSYLGYSEGKFLLGRLNDRREIEKQYYLTRHGVRLNRIEYKEALLFQDGAARVRADAAAWGLVSYTGYYLIKPRFFMLSAFEYGLARFQMRFTLGVFSLEGTPVLPVGYDAIYFDNQLKKIRYEKGNALGYLFADGRICWPETE
jgi:hypothetical protein